MKITRPQTIFSAILLASILPGASAIADVDRIYLENSGYVHFDPENASIPADWEIGTEIEGFRGAGYIEWTGPDFFSKNNAGNGTITYHFQLETAGNYELRWRSRIAKGDSNTESNDSWARFDTGSNVPGEEPLYGWTKVYMGESDIWSWSSRTVDEVARPVRQFFTAGVHTVEISGRSYGHAIDRIALYRYEDVNFDSGLNGTLPLSLVARGDGTIVDPNPVEVPEPEVVLLNRVNVEAATAINGDSNMAVCSGNTLSLPAINMASVNTLDTPASFSPDTLLTDPGVQRLLLTFDLSDLPSFTTARLNYLTGSNISNGSLDIFLGSHSDWSADNHSNVPDAMVILATAQGGWEADTRYESVLSASLLTREKATFIIDAKAGSDRFELATQTGGQSNPTLLLSGNNDFCSSWQANMAEPTQTTPENIEEAITTGKSKGGGIAHWFGLILFAGFLGKFISRHHCYGRLLSR